MSRRERKSYSRSASKDRKRSSSPQNGKEEGARDLPSKVKTEEDISALTRFIKDKKTIEVLNKKGIKFFFPVQYNTFEIIYKGKDLIARDRTGSGKTMAFSLPIIERFRNQNAFEKARTKFLIVLPTRQLAIQVKNQIDSVRHNSSEFSVVNVYGGSDIYAQIRQLQNGADIVVATPGRLLDLLERGKISLSHLQATCLDEADEMLKQGFQEDIEKIFQYIEKHGPKKTQNLLFSATLPSWVNEISRKYLSSDRDFVDLIKNSDIKTSKTVQHLGINCPYFSRNSVIADVVNLYGGRHGRTIIFAETKKQVNQIILKANLRQQAQPLHGDIPQKQREVAFKSFKEGKLKCLVATNVAARGLDIPEVDLIVQLEPPKDVETYIHRAGRTGRAGRSGTCVTFYTRAQLSIVQRIERIAKIKIKIVGPPQPADILKASARDIVLSLKQVSQTVLPHFNQIAEQMIEEEGAVKALSKALAYISGDTQKISQRSLLNSADGFITYILKSPVEFNSNGYVFNFLRGFASERFMDEIKGMRKVGQCIAAFDIPETFKEQMDKIQNKVKDQQGRARGFTLKVAESLEDLQDPNEAANKSDRSEDQEINENDKRQAIRRKRDLEIFVGGLPYNADETEVKTFFKSKGVSSVSARLLRNDNGESRGVAFVLCLDDKAVKRALTLDGEKFGSRSLKINLAARGG